MRPYSEAVKADVRRRMSPPNRQNVVEIAQELGIHSATLYKWRKAWRLQGDGRGPMVALIVLSLRISLSPRTRDPNPQRRRATTRQRGADGSARLASNTHPLARP